MEPSLSTHSSLQGDGEYTNNASSSISAQPPSLRLWHAARIAPPQVQGLVFLFHGDQTKPSIRLKVWKMDAEQRGVPSCSWKLLLPGSHMLSLSLPPSSLFTSLLWERADSATITSLPILYSPYSVF